MTAMDIASTTSRTPRVKKPLEKPEAEQMEKPEATGTWMHLYFWGVDQRLVWALALYFASGFLCEQGGLKKNLETWKEKKRVGSCLPITAEHDRSTFGFSCCGCENYSHDTVVCGYLDAEI